MLTEITNRSGEPLYASAADAQGGRNHPESVDELPWNQWTICSGISGRFELECVVDLRRNTQLGSFDRLGVIRADASWGTGADIQELVDLGLTFIVKGFSNRTALNFAARVAPTQWESLDLFTRICDLGPHRITNCRHLVPVVLVELMTERYDRPSYSHLYTTLSPEQADAEQIFTRYNGRQSIEALLKSTKYGLSIEHLRTRRSYPMENFLHVAAITFNLLSWFRAYVLAQVDLDNLGLCELTNTLMDIPAKCTWQANELRLTFPARHPLAPALAQL